MKEIPFENILLFGKQMANIPFLNQYRLFEVTRGELTKYYLATSIYSDVTNKREEIVNCIDITPYIFNITVNDTIRQLTLYIQKCDSIASINIESRTGVSISEIKNIRADIEKQPQNVNRLYA